VGRVVVTPGSTGVESGGGACVEAVTGGIVTSPTRHEHAEDRESGAVSHSETHPGSSTGDE
jgi:hypothetical protein